MTALEIIDRQCAVIEMQSRLIRDLFTFIDEQVTVDEEIKKTFAEKSNSIDAEADRLGLGLRSFMPFGCGKELNDE